MGAVLAIYRVPVTTDRPVRRTRAVPVMEVAGWVGLALIIGGFLFGTKTNNFHGVMALAPALGALALLVSIADGTTGPARLLAKPFPVLIGKLSYSLYLWHWPMIVIGRTYADLIGMSQRAGTLIGAAIGVALAVIAYRSIEHPLRQRRRGRGLRLLVLCTAFCVCFVFCLAISLRHPVWDELGRFDRPTFNGRLYNVGTNANGPRSIRFADVLLSDQPSQTGKWRNGGVIHNWGPGGPRIVVMGSSYAVMYGKVIDDICKQEGLSVAFLGAGGAPVFFPTGQNSSFPTLKLSQEFDAARRKWIREWNPDAVLVVERWDTYAADRAAFDRRLRELVGELSPHTGRIVLFSQAPVLRVGPNLNLREFVTWHLKTFGRLPKIEPDDNEAIRKSSNIIIEAVARDFPKVQLLRVDPQFYMEDGSVRYSSGRSFFYADNHHLTQAGAEQVRPLIATTIVAIKETGRPDAVPQN